jgi:hypothetical protein
MVNGRIRGRTNVYVLIDSGSEASGLIGSNIADQIIFDAYPPGRTGHILPIPIGPGLLELSIDTHNADQTYGGVGIIDHINVGLKDILDMGYGVTFKELTGIDFFRY